MTTFRDALMRDLKERGHLKYLKSHERGTVAFLEIEVEALEKLIDEVFDAYEPSLKFESMYLVPMDDDRFSSDTLNSFIAKLQDARTPGAVVKVTGAEFAIARRFYPWPPKP